MPSARSRRFNRVSAIFTTVGTDPPRDASFRRRKRTGRTPPRDPAAPGRPVKADPCRAPPSASGRLPAATAALHSLADRHPDLFADTVRYLFGVDRDIAAAVTESVRLGHALDEPLDAALNAAGTAESAP